jgi:hypothetical protein
MEKKILDIYTPIIITEEISVEELLKKYFSNGEIKRLKKQNGIKIANCITSKWVKVGKVLFILTSSEEAYKAQVWWEYHYSLKPKELKFEKYE